MAGIGVMYKPEGGREEGSMQRRREGRRIEQTPLGDGDMTGQFVSWDNVSSLNLTFVTATFFDTKMVYQWVRNSL